jgi:hypothetical protein
MTRPFISKVGKFTPNWSIFPHAFFELLHVLRTQASGIDTLFGTMHPTTHVTASAAMLS